MDIQKRNFLSIDQLADRYLAPAKQADAQGNRTDISFQDVLRQKTLQGQAQELKFSKHATGRLNARGIELSESQMERLSDGVRRAGQKGIRDSLVIVDELAFIVNVPNSTVVTVMDSTQTDDNVFTNINGAVIM
ncbi:MAG: flagellar protein [Clostridium sp.]|nr:flagellar protein [Acetatifactor muris]MCM1526012.1 flagellar protein [Bacteroides sp.]MCM1562228.1 flagellar protein [Clostridium sp.]